MWTPSPPKFTQKYERESVRKCSLVHTAFCQCTGADDTGQYKSERTKRQKNGFQKKVPAARTASGDPLLLVAVLASGGAFYYFAGAKGAGSEKLIVYNWGDYVDPQNH